MKMGELLAVEGSFSDGNSGMIKKLVKWTDFSIEKPVDNRDLLAIDSLGVLHLGYYHNEIFYTHELEEMKISHWMYETDLPPIREGTE